MRKLMRLSFCGALVALVASGIWAAVTFDQLPSDVLPSSEISSSGVQGIDQTTNLTLKQLVDRSDRIVIGKAVDTKAVWVDRVIYTVATIEVSETLKGESTPTVTVAVPGGADTNREVPVAMTYPGGPQIFPNEEVVLFLARGEDGGADAATSAASDASSSTAVETVPDSFSITGYSQGKYSLVKDSAGQQFVSRGQNNVAIGGGPGLARGSVALTPLAEFKANIARQQQ